MPVALLVQKGLKCIESIENETPVYGGVHNVYRMTKTGKNPSIGNIFFHSFHAFGNRLATAN
jgi:hypothetical protein